MKNNAQHQLYAFGYNVRPTPKHPAFGEIQTAVLWVFMVGDPGITVANYRASSPFKISVFAIPTHLYEMVNDVVGFNTIKDGERLKPKAADKAADAARVVGVGFYLNCAPGSVITPD